MFESIFVTLRLFGSGADVSATLSVNSVCVRRLRCLIYPKFQRHDKTYIYF